MNLKMSKEHGLDGLEIDPDVVSVCGEPKETELNNSCHIERLMNSGHKFDIK